MNKKIIPLILTILIIAIILIAILILQSQNQNSHSIQENNAELTSPISIEKIVLYSNASALNDYSNPWWNLNIYQYTDIAVYLKNLDNKLLKNITIDNINFSEGPNLGTPTISYISPLNLGKSTENIYEASPLTEISYNVKNFSEEETFETPTFFDNFSSPITMRYINKNIVKDYVLKSDASSSITFDGTLLKQCSISCEDISCKVSFDLTISFSESDSHKYNIAFYIPLEEDSESIYDGSILETLSDQDLEITQIY